MSMNDAMKKKISAYRMFPIDCPFMASHEGTCTE